MSGFTGALLLFPYFFAYQSPGLWMRQHFVCECGASVTSSPEMTALALWAGFSVLGTSEGCSSACSAQYIARRANVLVTQEFYLRVNWEIANDDPSPKIRPLRSVVRESGVWPFSMRAGWLVGCALFRRSGGAVRYAVGRAAYCCLCPLEENVRRSRYVVSGRGGEWQVRRTNSRVTETFPSKARALCAAIELAQKGGARGEAPEVLVRHEDDRFITEWVYGEDLHPDDAARPAGEKQPGRSGA
jgi:hypothetical protein